MALVGQDSAMMKAVNAALVERVEDASFASVAEVLDAFCNLEEAFEALDLRRLKRCAGACGVLGEVDQQGSGKMLRERFWRYLALRSDSWHRP